MNENAELLNRYAADHSESAFSELVGRHVDLVHSAALRLVSGDVHRAQDVTQQVFAELARQAKRLTRHPTLTGWLYTTTRLLAMRVTRTEQRRKAREQEANVMNELLREPTPESDWTNLARVLDDAMHKLGEKDRLAVLLRFFQNKSLKEIGVALGLSENAARMRVERSLDKLRLQLERKGVKEGAAALALTLTSNAVTATPSVFAATLTSASMASAATATGSAFSIVKLMAMTNLKTSIVAAIAVVTVGMPLLVQHQSQVKLREQNASLRQQVDQLAQLTLENERLSNLLASSVSPKPLPMPRLPAPRTAGVAVPAQPETEDVRSTNLIAQLMKGKNPPKLTTAQLTSYLQENRRSAASLLAAFRTTGDPKLLQEAMEKFPDHPQVAFAAAFKKDASPEEQRRWLETFKKSAPDNALATYLSALNYFKAGQMDQGVQELVAASGRQQFQDYSAEFVQNDEEAWRSAGYSVAESKTIASMALVLPHLAQLKQLSQEMVSLANSYRQAGDETSAQAALQMGFNLGQHLDGSPGQALITQLVGVAIQRIALTAMDPNSAYVSPGYTVKDQLDQLAQQRAAIRDLATQFDGVQQKMSDQDWISYKDRWRAFGEEAALRWVVSKYGQNNPNP